MSDDGEKPPEKVTRGQRRALKKQAYLQLRETHADEIRGLEHGATPIEIIKERETEAELSRRFNRPAKYGVEMVDEILLRLAEGENLAAICNSDPERFPRTTTFLQWVNKDDPPGLFAAYARARIAGAHAMADAIVAIADSAKPYEVDVAKLRMEARKWYVAKVLPKVYGDRVDITSGGEKVTMQISKDDDDLC